MATTVPAKKGVVLGLGWFILASSGPSFAVSASPPPVWQSPTWRVDGESVERSTRRVVVRQARAEVRGGDWQVVADRWVGVRNPHHPGELVAWRASGDVRAVGPSPGYLVGSVAVSFRPARAFVVAGRDAPVDWIGADWTLPAGRVAVDFRRSELEARRLGTGGVSPPDAIRSSAPDSNGS